MDDDESTGELTPDEGGSAALAQPPGPGLAALLSSVDIDELSTHDLVAAIQAVERQKAFDEAQQVHMLAALTMRDEYQRCTCPSDSDIAHVHRPVEPAGDEVSLALACSPGRAKNRVALAVELAEDLPDTLESLHTGSIDYDKARLIAERTRCLDTTRLRRQVEAQVLPIARRKTRTQLDYALRRAVIAADPDAAEQRRQAAAEHRRISRPEPSSAGADDGMATMNLYGPIEDLTALYTAIDAAARHARTNGDDRTLEQLRHDILTGLGWTGLNLAHLGCCNPTCSTPSGDGSAFGPVAEAAHPPDEPGATRTAHRARASGAAPRTKRGDDHRADGRAGDDDDAAAGGADNRSGGGGNGVAWLGRRHGRAAAVNVTVAASTLFGADEQPGWLDGFGPLTAHASRRISTEGPWRRLLTDPDTRELLDYGRSTYAPPQHLAAFVAARDHTCRLPTCHHPAREADIDHRSPYHHGGTTSATNTWALHPGHHFARTHHGYTIHTDTNDTTWWTTPAGHHYPVDPEPIGPLLQHRHPATTTTRNEAPPF